MVRLIILSILLLSFNVCYAAVYEIVEPDFIETAREYSRSDDFKKRVYEERDKEIKRIKNLSGELLYQADENYSYDVEYFWTLEQDIPKVDRDGNIVGILYPKGYVFQPLKYIKNPPAPLIIYNPCIKEELELVKKIREDFDSSYKRYILLTSGCSLEDISKLKIGYPTYLLDKHSVEQFALKNTVSIVTADLIKGVFNVKVYTVKK